MDKDFGQIPRYKTAKVEDLIPYARNSRTHSDAQVSKIAASIREFGFLNPVIIDGQNGIIAGHGRVMAAQDEALATWEPSIDRPPAYRPDLLMLGLSRPPIICKN